MIISSQRFINEEIVTEKISSLAGLNKITLPVFDVNDENLGDMAILADGHHTLEAAKRLGITVAFDHIDHPEKLTGERLLEECYFDSDYYDIETGSNVW